MDGVNETSNYINNMKALTPISHKTHQKNKKPMQTDLTAAKMVYAKTQRKTPNCLFRALPNCNEKFIIKDCNVQIQQSSTIDSVQ